MVGAFHLEQPPVVAGSVGVTATPSFRSSGWSTTGNWALQCEAGFGLLRGSNGRLSGWVKLALYLYIMIYTAKVAITITFLFELSILSMLS